MPQIDQGAVQCRSYGTRLPGSLQKDYQAEKNVRIKNSKDDYGRN